MIPMTHFIRIIKLVDSLLGNTGDYLFAVAGGLGVATTYFVDINGCIVCW